MIHRHLCLASLAAALLVQGCASRTPPAQTGTVDNMLDGQAKTCTPSAPDLSASASAQATIAMTDDGWCGVTVVEKDGQAFALGLLATRPAHGRVFEQRVNNRTRIEYTPNPGYVGADAFSVTLRSRTAGAPEATLQVAVMVTQGERPAVTAPAAKPPAPARSTTTRPATPRRTTAH